MLLYLYAAPQENASSLASILKQSTATILPPGKKSHHSQTALYFRNNGYNAYGAGKLLHEGQGGDFYTDYGYDVDYASLSRHHRICR